MVCAFFWWQVQVETILLFWYLKVLHAYPLAYQKVSKKHNSNHIHNIMFAVILVAQQLVILWKPLKKTIDSKSDLAKTFYSWFRFGGPANDLGNQLFDDDLTLICLAITIAIFNHILSNLASFYLTYSVFRTDWTVLHLLEATGVQEPLDFGQPLNVLGFGHLTVDGFKNFPRPVDAPLDGVVLVRICLSVALLQQLLQQQRVLDQALVLHWQNRWKLKRWI